MTIMGNGAVPEERLTNGIQNGTGVSAHVLLIPHPALPHITPMMHLAQQLISQGGIQCTIVSFDYLIDKVAKHALGQSVHLLGLPKDLIGFSEKWESIPPVVHREELRCTIKVYVDELLRKRAAGERAPKYACLISDLMEDWAIDFASKLECSCYCFAAVSASFCLNIASFYLMKDTGEEADFKRASSWLADPAMPKLKPVDCGMPFAEVAFGIILNQHDNITRSDGVLINTFYEMESRSIDYLRDMGRKVFPVGPLESEVQVSKVSFESDNNVDDECLQWLDKQPAKSVVYVNFGTTGFNVFNLQMVHELALGLEASEARFLWVLRPPPSLKPEELDQLLPSGFEERVKDRALISRGWAPQLKILEHPSTATFLMQCGWNSMQEAVLRGIPFIGYATYADQPFNALYAAEVARVGLMLPSQEKEVDRHYVSTAVRKVMFSEEGLLMRTNAEEMKSAAVASVKPGGSSHTSKVDFAKTIKVAQFAIEGTSITPNVFHSARNTRLFHSVEQSQYPEILKEHLAYTVSHC